MVTFDPICVVAQLKSMQPGSFGKKREFVEKWNKRVMQKLRTLIIDVVIDFHICSRLQV